MAFDSSFLLVIFGGPRFDALRANTLVQALFTSTGPAVIGAITGFAIPSRWPCSNPGSTASSPQQLWLRAAHRGVVSALLGAGTLGIAAALAGWPVA
ncbi:hypothetical protein [Streptomyces sp. NPDC001500]